MAIKKYILTIEYDDSEDSCEYIQEEIVDCSPESRTIYEATVDDYFDEIDLAYLSSDEIAKA